MQVVDAIYAVLKQQPYYKEMWQFNITVKEDPATKVKTTTITGWSEHKTEIETIAKNTAQGCTYNAQSPFVLTRDELLPQYRISCPPNMAPCGDICIQIGDYCKLTQLEAKAPPTPVGSPTATPVVAVNPNSNTGSNSNTKKY
jgi:hypothetical protein